MRIFRILVIACGLLLLLTACTSTSDNGTGTSSVRSAPREGKTSSAGDRQSSVAFQSSVRPSSVSSSSLGTQSMSSSSAQAPFFSIQSRSSAAASSVVSFDIGGTASSASAVVAGRVKLHVEPDRSEARAGDDVAFTITVRNISSTPLENFQVVYSFLPTQLVVLETDGKVQGNAVLWSLEDLQPNQRRALRIRGTLAQGLQPGESIRGTAVATINGVVEPQTYTSEIRVITVLPNTGPGDGVSPLENTRRFLTPFRAEGGTSALPLIVWTATILMGLALGMRVMKRR